MATQKEWKSQSSMLFFQFFFFCPPVSKLAVKETFNTPIPLMTVAEVQRKKKSVNLNFRWRCEEMWNWLILHSCTFHALAVRLCAGGCVISYTLQTDRILYQCGTDWQRRQHPADATGWFSIGCRNKRCWLQTCTQLKSQPLAGPPESGRPMACEGTDFVTSPCKLVHKGPECCCSLSMNLFGLTESTSWWSVAASEKHLKHCLYVWLSDV